MTANAPTTPSATGARVLDQIQQARQSVEQLVASLDEAALTAPGPDGGWSIKDHLAHLTAWRRMVLGYLDGRPAVEGLGVSPETYAQGEDAINAALEAQHRERPLAQVLAEFRRVYDDLSARLAALTEAEWHQPYPHNPPSQNPRLDNIEGNTFAHDLEHLGWMEALLRGRKATS